jgi:RNA polymerase sigma-70 factor (ECF subfamily)
MLYEQYKHRLILFAKKYVSCEETVKDIVAEVFNKLLYADKLFENPKHVKDYLYLCVRNACIDYLREKQVAGKYRSYNQDEPLNVYALNETEEFEKEHSELMRLIHAAIQKLPRRTRDAFIACVLEDRPLREVAASMNISVSRVKNYVTEAKQLLRREIQQSGRDFSWLKLWLLCLLSLLQLIKMIWIAIQHTVH